MNKKKLTEWFTLVTNIKYIKYLLTHSESVSSLDSEWFGVYQLRKLVLRSSSQNCSLSCCTGKRRQQPFQAQQPILRWVSIWSGLGRSSPQTLLLLCSFTLGFIVLLEKQIFPTNWKLFCRPHQIRFSCRISLYFAAVTLPCTLSSLPWPAANKHLHSMMQPPPYLTLGIECLWRCAGI